MERQEIFNILQNFNLPKNKKDIITDLILNNKDNNNSNNNTGNSNVIEYPNIVGADTDIDSIPFGYIRLKGSVKSYNSKGEITFGSKKNYIADSGENNFICIPGLHIDGEQTMNREEYNKAFLEAYSNLNVDDVNKEEVNYIINYIKKNNVFLINDGYDSAQTLVSNIYFINIDLGTNIFNAIFPIAYNISDCSTYVCNIGFKLIKGIILIQGTYEPSTYFYRSLIKSNG